jgi:hypothetical protein
MKTIQVVAVVWMTAGLALGFLLCAMFSMALEMAV